MVGQFTAAGEDHWLEIYRGNKERIKEPIYTFFGENHNWLDFAGLKSKMSPILTFYSWIMSKIKIMRSMLLFSAVPHNLDKTNWLSIMSVSRDHEPNGQVVN